jgi:hypothetical protein
MLPVALLVGCSKVPQERVNRFYCTKVLCSLECPAGASCTEQTIVTCRRPPQPGAVLCYPTRQACQDDFALPDTECHQYTISDYLAR